MLDWSGPNSFNGTDVYHSNARLFTPLNASADGWYEAVRANQFRKSCKRLLLVEDDLLNAGLGFTARMFTFALLWAMRTDRVLLEVPFDAKWGPAEQPPSAAMTMRSRWCDRPPYTMQCLYGPWTHCQAAAADAADLPSLRKECPPPLCNTSEYRLKSVSKDAPVVRVKLSWIHNSPLLWSGVKSTAAGAVARFLFGWPRAWVRDLAECVMSANHLKPRSFVALMIRDSIQKRAEVRADRAARAHGGLAKVGESFSIVQVVSRQLDLHVLWLQTSSAAALVDFSALAKADGRLHVAYTNNARGDSDAWGGANTARVMEEAIAGAVNGYVASQAAVLVSPAGSLWTWLTASLITTRTACRYSGSMPACPTVARTCQVKHKGAALLFAVAHDAATLAPLDSMQGPPGPCVRKPST